MPKCSYRFAWQRTLKLYCQDFSENLIWHKSLHLLQCLRGSAVFMDSMISSEVARSHLSAYPWNYFSYYSHLCHQLWLRMPSLSIFYLGNSCGKDLLIWTCQILVHFQGWNIDFCFALVPTHSPNSWKILWAKIVPASTSSISSSVTFWKENLGPMTVPEVQTFWFFVSFCLLLHWHWISLNLADEFGHHFTLRYPKNAFLPFYSDQAMSIWDFLRVLFHRCLSIAWKSWTLYLIVFQWEDYCVSLDL